MIPLGFAQITTSILNALNKERLTFIYYMISLLRQGTVERNYITSRKKLVKAYVSDSLPVVKTVGGIFVIRQHLHAKASADVNKHATDAPRTDNSDRFSVKVEARHTRKAEIKISCAYIRLVYSPDRRQKQRHSMLRNRIRRVRGHSENGYFSPRVFKIDVIESRATQSDELNAKILKLIYYGGVYRIVRFVETKNVVTLVAGILCLVPPISFAAWVIDLVTEIVNNKISVLAD